MSSPGSSSASSPHPPSSPRSSIHAAPNVERLVDHFVAAKRSLGATELVWKANELVTRSRSLVEQIAVLNAKNDYVRHGVEEQLNTLEAIRNGIAETGVAAERQLQTHLSTLDIATKRLEDTIEQLKGTIVHSTLQRLPSLQDPAEDDIFPTTSDTAQGEKTLFDFVDEAQHEDVLAALRGHVDSFFETARAGLAEHLDAIDGSIHSVGAALPSPTSKATSVNDASLVHDQPSSISKLFQALELSAAEMANLLQSLITHYDLCVTALKHTEGGGEAAKVAVLAEHLSNNTLRNEESLYGKTVAEPISDEERAEMLGIVENDAQEVEDVVAEIQDHITDMEAHFEQLEQIASISRGDKEKLREALAALRTINDSLPTHIAAAKTFNDTWRGIQGGIQTNTVALNEVTDFYTQFLASYDRLLQEIRRREVHAERMKAIATKASRELERLWEVDQDARRQFFDDVGGHLPRDLYPALIDKGTRWEVRAVQSLDEEDDFDENYDTSVTRL